MIIVKGKMMQIKNVNAIGKRKVYDISVKDAEHYVLENGVVTHNTGSYYAADNIYILGRQQEKEGTEISGYNFIINVEKSRYVREKSKIPISISFDNGVSKYSGLIDIALELGFVTKPSNGWYSRVNITTGEVEEKKYRLKETNTKDFWDSILNSKNFKDAIYNRYAISSGAIISDEEIDTEINTEINTKDEDIEND